MTSQAAVTAGVASVARAAFEPGFYLKGALRPEHRAETQQRLAQALVPSGVSFQALSGLALSVREIGDAEQFTPDAELTPKQKELWTKLMVEPPLPGAFRAILEAATPRLERRRDLYALYGVLSGTLDKLTTLSRAAPVRV